NYFIKKLQKQYKRPGLQIGKQAIYWLKGLSWSGNIRELKNLVERAVVISNKDNLELENFTKEFIIGPQKITSKKLPDVGAMTLEEIEKAMILKALKENKNISQVARSLGISRAALYRRMDKFGIEV
ncbi:MAG: helix-turn-helix domain-containing protein, partial [Candidatus Cloacimonetes bacterium]|nr:helix-turn-helix domain-containing protein [Candidatus Cloacimonadota bacterium]